MIYTRVSKLAGARSTGEQEKECRTWCEHIGHPVRAVFCDDNISASRFSTRDRPAWRQLKSELRAGDILVVWEASRAQRDLEEFVELRKLCAELQVPLSYQGRVLDLTLGDDRFVGGLDALLAERESEQIRTRVLRGKRTSAAAGTPSTGPPWGYGLVRPGEWRIDPIEGPRVRAAVTRLLDGESMRQILRWLTETEGKTPSSLTNLRRVLTNPVYAGLRVHLGKIIGPATWPPLITETQHHQVVALLKRQATAHGYVSTPGPEPKYLLSGIAVCGKCKKPLRARHRPRRSATYECPDGHVVRVMKHLDKSVEKKLFERASQIDPEQFGDDPGEQAIQAMQEIGEIEELYEGWKQAAIAGEVTPAAFAKIEKGFIERLNRLRPKTLGKPPSQRLPPGVLAKNWPILSMRERRDIVRVNFTIEVMPTAGVGQKSCPADAVIEPI